MARSTAVWGVLLSVVVVGSTALMPGRAHAGGFEFSGPGTRGLGRGGAFAARADDPMALLYNPAMLADLADSQVLANVHLAVWDACVQRSGTYGDSRPSIMTPTRFDGPAGMENDWTSEAFPRVCNSGLPQAIPQVLANVRLLPELGLAFGILAPNGVGMARFGNADGTVAGVTGAPRPTPVRYGVTEQDVLLFHPSVGLGYRPTSWLRIGLTLQWGMAIVRFVNYTNVGAGPEDPANDIRTQLDATDFFVPAGILSVHAVPHDNLDLMVVGRVSDAIDADGGLRLTTGQYGTGMDGGYIPTDTQLDGVHLHAGQPFTFTFGARYADRVRPRNAGASSDPAAPSSTVQDPMRDETFDVELDVSYEHNRQVTDFVVGLPTGAGVTINDGTVPIQAPLPASLPIPHGWQDVVAVRLGSDVNVAPGLLALRGGVHVEQPLGTSRLQINDFITGQRLGLHAGATLRLDRFDVSIAYAHIFQADQTITDGNFRPVTATGAEGQCAGDANYDPAQPVSSRGCYPQGFGAVVNNGTYTAQFNVLSLGASYHFE